MTMDYNPDRRETSVTDAEGVMFAPNPVWDRASRRKRSLGGRRATPIAASEPRTFADDASHTEINDDAPGMFAAADRRTGQRTTRGKASAGVAPAAFAAGAVALVALGATGWWMSRDASGIPELTPGSTTSEVAVAPLTPAPAPIAPPEMAVNPPSMSAVAEAPVRLAAAAPERVQRSAPAVRTRPAATTAPNAESSAVNASATLPDGPQPYTTLNPTVAPTPANPPPNQAVNPPEPIPSTPPIVTDPPPEATDTVTPDTTTPPQ